MHLDRNSVPHLARTVRRPRSVIVVALLVWTVRPLQAQGPFWAKLARPGPHAVGFRVVPLTDTSRPFRDKFDRPLPAYVWYPAAKGGTRLAYRRFVELMADEAALGDAGRDERRERAERWMAGLDEHHPGLGSRMASLPTSSVLNARPADDSFPLIVYVPGAGGSALENVALAELLASRGYVFAAIPSLGTVERVVHTTRRGLEAQARDIRFAVGQLAALAEVDGRYVAAMGWSWGGLAAMLAQMRDRRIGAVVSIDGSIAMHRPLAERMPGFSASRAQVPYLMVLASSGAAAAPGFFDQLRYSDAYYLAIAGAEHSDFTTRWGYLTNEALKGTNDYRPSVPTTYGTLLTATLSFLDEAFQRGAGDSARVLGAATGMELRHHAAAPAPPATFAFLDTLGRDPVAGWKIYRAVKAADSTYRLFEMWDAVELAFALFNRQHRPEAAIEVGRLLVDAYPNSYEAHGYLAELYRKHEDWLPALLEYSAAYAMGRAVVDSVWTTRDDDLRYYHRMMDELRAKVAK